MLSNSVTALKGGTHTQPMKLPSWIQGYELQFRTVGILREDALFAFPYLF